MLTLRYAGNQPTIMMSGGTSTLGATQLSLVKEILKNGRTALNKNMMIHIFFVVGAVVCTAIIAKYIWREKESFKTVYNDIKQELKQNINEGENY